MDTRNLGLGQISRVEIFGEFSEKSEIGSWGVKIPCESVLEQNWVYAVTVNIKIGHKFKFIIDSGRSYAVSSHYSQVSDGAGNLNNVFKFKSEDSANQRGF